MLSAGADVQFIADQFNVHNDIVLSARMSHPFLSHSFSHDSVLTKHESTAQQQRQQQTDVVESLDATPLMPRLISPLPPRAPLSSRNSIVNQLQAADSMSLQQLSPLLAATSINNSRRPAHSILDSVILAHIFAYLEPKDCFTSLSATCRDWSNAARKSEWLFRIWFMRKWPQESAAQRQCRRRAAQRPVEQESPQQHIQSSLRGSQSTSPIITSQNASTATNATTPQQLMMHSHSGSHLHLYDAEDDDEDDEKQNNNNTNNNSNNNIDSRQSSSQDSSDSQHHQQNSNHRNSHQQLQWFNAFRSRQLVANWAKHLMSHTVQHQQEQFNNSSNNMNANSSVTAMPHLSLRSHSPVQLRELHQHRRSFDDGSLAVATAAAATASSLSKSQSNSPLLQSQQQQQQNDRISPRDLHQIPSNGSNNRHSHHPSSNHYRQQQQQHAQHQQRRSGGKHRNSNNNNNSNGGGGSGGSSRRNSLSRYASYSPPLHSHNQHSPKLYRTSGSGTHSPPLFSLLPGSVIQSNSHQQHSIPAHIAAEAPLLLRGHRSVVACMVSDASKLVYAVNGELRINSLAQNGRQLGSIRTQHKDLITGCDFTEALLVSCGNDK
jgi:hypothetical protein